MKLRLCQLKSLWFLTLLTTTSCSFFRTESKDATELLSPMSNAWLSRNTQHSIFDKDSKPQSHHFFDVNPELSKSDIYINAVVATPEGSDHAYQLDLFSGQRYYSHSYCPQSDIWNEYSGSISKPTFTIGVIPRLLDQLGEPQKVFIFGGKKKFNELANNYEHRIRLVGAVVEQYCPEGNCLGKDNWVSHMVFLAVDPLDKKFKDVTDTVTLQKKIKWNQAKAVIANLDGRNSGGTTSYPAVRVGQMIPLYDAIDYYKSRSIYISDKESQKIQQGCQALYDRLWSEVGKEHAEDKPAKTVAELNAKVKLIEELKKKKKPIGFANRMKVFARKYSNEFSTCQRFVYAGNVNLDREKFWFLSYMGIYFRLHKDGHFFDCRTKTWQKNILNSFGKPVFEFERDIEYCKEKEFDYAMEYLQNYLAGLKMNENTYYKFVDYDTHTFGTHQKLYSWVKMKNKQYDCKFDPNTQVKKELKVFPEDVVWRKRDVKDIEDELKIIY